MNVNIVSKKQQALLIAGRKLFWRLGFKKVSVEDICSEASVSKMTFYKYFADKTDLAKAVIEDEMTVGLERFERIMRNETTISGKLAELMSIKADAVRQISPEFMRDFYQDEQLGLQAHILECTRASSARMIQLFSDAQARGLFRNDFHPEFLLHLANKFSDLITDPFLMQLCGGSEQVIMELTKLLTFGIAPRNDAL